MLEFPTLSLAGSNPRGRPRVVLLGLPADLDGSRRLLTRLAGDGDLLAVGSLPSELGERAPTWTEQVDWLTARLDREGWGERRVDLLGWSFGGAWALQLLRAAPQRVERAVLAVTCAHFRARERALLSLLRRLLLADIEPSELHRGLLPMLFSAEFLHRPGAFATLAMHLDRLVAPREQWAAQLDNLLDHDVRAGLAGMTAIRTVIAGTHDWLFPPGEVARLSAALPSAELVHLPSGHGVWFEAEDAFVAIVRRALDEHSP